MRAHTDASAAGESRARHPSSSSVSGSCASATAQRERRARRRGIARHRRREAVRAAARRGRRRLKRHRLLIDRLRFTRLRAHIRPAQPGQPCEQARIARPAQKRQQRVARAAGRRRMPAQLHSAACAGRFTRDEAQQRLRLAQHRQRRAARQLERHAGEHRAPRRRAPRKEQREHPPVWILIGRGLDGRLAQAYHALSLPKTRAFFSAPLQHEGANSLSFLSGGFFRSFSFCERKRTKKKAQEPAWAVPPRPPVGGTHIPRKNICGAFLSEKPRRKKQEPNAAGRAARKFSCKSLPVRVSFLGRAARKFSRKSLPVRVSFLWFFLFFS